MALRTEPSLPTYHIQTLQQLDELPSSVAFALAFGRRTVWEAMTLHGWDSRKATVLRSNAQVITMAPEVARHIAAVYALEH